MQQVVCLVPGLVIHVPYLIKIILKYHIFLNLTCADWFCLYGIELAFSGALVFLLHSLTTSLTQGQCRERVDVLFLHTAFILMRAFLCPHIVDVLEWMGFFFLLSPFNKGHILKFMDGCS